MESRSFFRKRALRRFCVNFSRVVNESSGQLGTGMECPVVGSLAVQILCEIVDRVEL